MRARVFFGLTSTHGGFPFDELPLEVDLGEAFVNVSRDASDEQLDLTVDLSVNPSTLRVETDPARGTQPQTRRSP